MCTVSLTVENVSSIRFHKLHVYKQLYTCIYTHLYKFNQLVIVISYLYSDCLIHLFIIMYLFCIHLSFHIVYKMFKSYNYLCYEGTHPLLSTTHSQPQNYWSFINSKHLLRIPTLLTHISVCSLFVTSLVTIIRPRVYLFFLGCKLMAICIILCLFLLCTCVILLLQRMRASPS